MERLENLRSRVEETFSETERIKESCSSLEVELVDIKAQQTKELLCNLNLELADRQQSLNLLEDKMNAELKHIENLKADITSISIHLQAYESEFFRLKLKMDADMNELNVHHMEVYETISNLRELHDMAQEDLRSLQFLCQSQHHQESQIRKGKDGSYINFNFGNAACSKELKDIEWHRRLLHATKIQKQEAEQQKVLLIKERHALISI